MSAVQSTQKKAVFFRLPGKSGIVSSAALLVILLHGLGNAADDAGLTDMGFLAPVRSGEGLANQAMVLASREDFVGGISAGRAAVRRLPVKQSIVRRLGEVELLRDGSDAWSNDTIKITKALGWRDSPSQARLLMVSAEGADLDAAIDHIDAVLRRATLSPEVFKAISIGVANDTIRASIVKRLAQNPPWRLSLLQSVDEYGDVASTQSFARLLSDLAELEGTALPKEEVDPVLSRLAALDLNDLLAQTAAELDPVSPSDKGLNDPAFVRLGDDARSSDAVVGPFEWKRGKAQGVVVTVAPREKVESALTIRSRSRVRGPILYQSLRLQPGRYRFSFQQLGSGKEAEGLDWRIAACSEKANEVSATTGASSREWAERSIVFTVPANCPIQTLILGTGPNLRGETRQASFSGLKIAEL